jgi:uncharacterized protein
MNDDKFEWDEAKNAANFAKHGVWFERACLVFTDVFAISEYDDRADYGEDRFTITGMVDGTLLFVVFTERTSRDARGVHERVRIITARRATKHEQDDYYEQNNQGP